MNLKKHSLFKFFHYLWIILASLLIIYIINKNIVIQRELVYKLDFEESITRDITGWYPDIRTVTINNELHILAEPLYLKVYTPVQFNNLIIKGEIDFAEEIIKIGLKQKDNSYLYKDINSKDINLNFDLENALINGNKLELILSLPDLVKTSNINLRNWELILKR